MFNIPLIPYYLSQSILNQADRIMIERLDSASSAGIYSVAYSLATTMQIIHVAINSSLVPWQFQTMKERKSEKVAKMINILMLMVAGVYMLLIFISPEVMSIFAAKEYYESIYVVPPVVIGVLAIWFTQIFINVEFFYEKNGLLSISSIIVAVLNVILNYIAIPRLGYIAAAYTTLICYLLHMIFHGIIAIKLTHINNMEIPFELDKIILLTIICIVSMFGIMFFYDYPIIRYMILIIYGGIAIIKKKTLTELVLNTWNIVRNREGA